MVLNVEQNVVRLTRNVSYGFKHAIISVRKNNFQTKKNKKEKMNELLNTGNLEEKNGKIEQK